MILGRLVKMRTFQKGGYRRIKVGKDRSHCYFQNVANTSIFIL